MASREITEITSAGALSGTEVVHIVQGGNSRKTTTADLASFGLVSGVNNVFAHLRQSGNQSLSGGSTTIIEFGSVVEDAESLWDGTNHYFDIPSALNGKLVFVHASMQHTADGSGGLEMFLEHSTDNGATYARVGQSPNAAIDHFGITDATALVRVSTSDRIRLRIFSSSSKTTSSGAQATFIKAVALDTATGGSVPGQNLQVGTTYTLAVTDDEDSVVMSNASANVLTIPANAAAAIAIGAEIPVWQGGAGITTITAAAGVTLNGVSEGSASLSGIHARVSLYKRGVDAWYISGDHEAVS